jgi:hypothetical protein
VFLSRNPKLYLLHSGRLPAFTAAFRQKDSPNFQQASPWEGALRLACCPKKPATAGRLAIASFLSFAGRELLILSLRSKPPVRLARQNLFCT